MGRYVDTFDSIFSIFASDGWQAKNIPTYPDNVLVDKDEFIRVSILTDSKSVNFNSVGGVLKIAIFTSLNSGPKRYVEIADILDDFLFMKTIFVDETRTSNVVFTESTCSTGGMDDKYSISIYTISFNLYRKRST
jgi:hypothetical protein